jgi:hypothetical protein
MSSPSTVSPFSAHLSARPEADAEKNSHDVTTKYIRSVDSQFQVCIFAASTTLTTPSQRATNWLRRPAAAAAYREKSKRVLPSNFQSTAWDLLMDETFCVAASTRLQVSSSAPACCCERAVKWPTPISTSDPATSLGEGFQRSKKSNRRSTARRRL